MVAAMKGKDPNSLSRGGCLMAGLVLAPFAYAVNTTLQAGSGSLTQGDWILVFAVGLLSVAIAWARLKDAGIRPWWALFMLVPFVSLVVVGVCLWTPTKNTAARQ